MRKDNNIYGKLINNKFSELLSTGMNTTWQQMKSELDREMPLDNERRGGIWNYWRTTGTILAFLLLIIAVIFYSYNKHRNG